MKRLFLTGVSSIVLAACGKADTSFADSELPKSNPVTSNNTDPLSSRSTDIVPPARDGNIAIEEEFQAAEIKGTIEAYELFMARHPDHEISKLAKIRIVEVKSKR